MTMTAVCVKTCTSNQANCNPVRRSKIKQSTARHSHLGCSDILGSDRCLLRTWENYSNQNQQMWLLTKEKDWLVSRPPKNFGQFNKLVYVDICCSIALKKTHHLFLLKNGERMHIEPKKGLRAGPPTLPLLPWMANNAESSFHKTGTPKSSILRGFSILNHPFWGTLVGQHWLHKQSKSDPMISFGRAADCHSKVWGQIELS